jgi:hypothetical protein
MKPEERDDHGPESVAPENPEFASSFDEYAGMTNSGAKGLFFAERGEDYGAFRAAYEFGAQLATDEDFRDLDWAGAADRVRQRWNEKQPESWDRLRSAIEQGWETVRGT